MCTDSDAIRGAYIFRFNARYTYSSFSLRNETSIYGLEHRAPYSMHQCICFKFYKLATHSFIHSFAQWQLLYSAACIFFRFLSCSLSDILLAATIAVNTGAPCATTFSLITTRFLVCMLRHSGCKFHHIITD